MQWVAGLIVRFLVCKHAVGKLVSFEACMVREWNDLQMLFVEFEHLNDMIVSIGHTCSRLWDDVKEEQLFENDLLAVERPYRRLVA